MSSGIRRLFWDIETSPNIHFSWRAGGKIYLGPQTIIRERQIICICWKWEDQKKVHSLNWNDGSDADMVKEFASVIDSADELVAHNGDKFDLRWYNARSLINGFPPLPQPKTVDTLKIARKYFYLNSNRLDYLANLLFGEGKIKTEYALWEGCVDITEPDPAARERNVAKMVRYCKKDAVLVQRVWEELRGYDTPKTHAAVLASGDPRDSWMCPHCGSPDVNKSKTRVTAKGSVQHQMKCNDCGRYYSIANSVFRTYLEYSKEHGV